MLQGVGRVIERAAFHGQCFGLFEEFAEMDDRVDNPALFELRVVQSKGEKLQRVTGRADSRGNFVRDALDRGYRLGLIGSGDSHDGHPGLAQLASGNGGLAAILTSDFSRKGVLAALKARRTYATNGPRILLIATLDGEPLGSVIQTGGGTHQIRLQVVGTSRLARVELIKNGKILTALPGDEKEYLLAERSLDEFSDGDYLYLRILQSDGGAAWSSPFFFES